MSWYSLKKRWSASSLSFFFDFSISSYSLEPRSPDDANEPYFFDTFDLNDISSLSELNMCLILIFYLDRLLATRILSNESG
jgi:hypothetical protein